MERVPVAVIGGGQAGLAASHELTALGVEHLVLERGRVGQTWRDRWDSFCLVTPNWTVRLPGGPYDGDEPDGYMARDEIVAYLDRYAAGFGAPVREGVDVTGLTRDEGSFQLETSAGAIRARDVVLATGAYQRPYRPPGAGSLPTDLRQIDLTGFTNEGALPPGKVLIVGSGQSGCQIAEELHGAGREVFLSCGRAPWAPRRLGDRDLVWWVVESGFMDQTASALPEPSARLWANILATGHDGGHDLHLRTLHAMGVTLLGRFLGADGRSATFADDLTRSVAWGDERYRQLMDLISRAATERGVDLPIAEPEPFEVHTPERVNLAGFGAVIFTGGFRPDYRSWLPWPDAFDELGFPIHHEGTSTVVPGLHFVGVHFLRTRKSSLLMGVGEDAAIVARTIAG
jgi:putative flavoprotein involved in K+ transport